MGEKLEAIIARVKSDEIVRNIGVSYLLGCITGGIGRQIGGDYQIGIPAIPPVMDFVGSGKCISPYIIPYALGVASNHVELIYESTKKLL